jgi:hypothetical protein
MPAAVVNSTGTFANLIGTSRSTITVTLPSVTSRALVLFLDAANAGSGNANPPSVLPQFGGVDVSVITRPVNGVGSTIQAVSYYSIIADAAAGDFAITFIKDHTSDVIAGWYALMANCDLSAISSRTSFTNVGTINGLSTELVPPSVSSDMCLIHCLSGNQQAVTKLGDGSVVYSDLTSGGNLSNNYFNRFSAYTMQGDSGVSVNFSVASGTRIRTIAVIVPGLPDSGGGGGGGSGAGGWIQPLALSTISLLDKNWVGAWSKGVV